MNSPKMITHLSGYLTFHTDSAGFSTHLIRILFAGIPAYALFKVAQTTSLTYLSYFLSFIIAWTLFVIIDRLQLRQEYKLLIVIAIWLSILGRIYFYTNFQYYDKMLHFFTPFITTLITYDCLSRTSKFSNRIYAFLLVAVILSMHEIFEFLLDYFHFLEFKTRGVYDSYGNEVMSPAMDTAIDLVLGLFAASIALLIRSPQKKMNKTAMQLFICFAFILILLTGSGHAFSVVPGISYPVACTSLEHDPDKIKEAQNRGITLEELRAGGTRNSRKIYIDQVLKRNALGFDLRVPNDPDLYGRESGNILPYALLVCHPTTAENTAPDYLVPGTSLTIPKMQDTPFPLLPDNKKYPLVLLSHGLGMDPLNQRIFDLAGEGLIVAAPFHGDMRFPFPTIINLRRVELLTLRPLTLKKTINYLFEHPVFKESIDETRIGGMGISFGGTAMLALMGAEIIGPDIMSMRNTATDLRLSAAANIVPFLGHKFLFPVFGLNAQGAGNVHLPYLAYSSTADSISDISVARSVLDNKPGSTYMVQIENEAHWISEETIDNAFQWSLIFLNAYLKGDPAALDAFALNNSIKSPVTNSVVLSRPVSPEYSEQLFDLTEKQFPDIFQPGQSTHVIDGIIFRYYPEREVYLASYSNELYYLDNSGTHPLGPVMYWWSQLKNNHSD